MIAVVVTAAIASGLRNPFMTAVMLVASIVPACTAMPVAAWMAERDERDFTLDDCGMVYMTVLAAALVAYTFFDAVRSLLF